MSTGTININCPKCGYNNADQTCNYLTSDEYFNCIRCGFSVSDTIEVENFNTGKIVSRNHQEKGGIGSFIIRRTGECGFTFGAVEILTIEQLKESLSKFDVCKFTFYKDGHWYIHDLLNDAEEQFTEKGLWG